MPQRSARLRIEVAASTSNLGTGFDALGLALSLWLGVEVAAAEGPDGSLERGSLPPGWPDRKSDLLLDSFERARTAWGGPSRALRFDVQTRIPLGRGLGSSAAAVVAGLSAAAALAPRAVSRGELLQLAIEIEGHPDNVAPALRGGCVLAVPRPGAPPRVLDIELHPSLAFALAWPDVEVSTRTARALLPKAVPLADAVENARRLALLIEGLRTADAELLALGAEDRLHVPYRLPLLPGGAAALSAARSAGASLATISGSGSALFAICPRGRAAEVASAMAGAMRAACGSGTARTVEVAGPARVVKT